MSNEPKPIDLNTLERVTGGKHGGGSKGGDPLLNDLNYLATSIKDLTQKTSGFSSTSMFLLFALALQRQNNGYGSSNVVYIQRGRW